LKAFDRVLGFFAHPPKRYIPGSLLLDSKVFRDQELKERRKQRFASLADVVHELEASQGDREFLVGNAPMRAQPTPQERPKAFHRVDVHFAQAVAIVSAGQLASPVVATLMAVTPRLQTGINAVRIGRHPCPWHAGVFDDGLDGLVLPVGQAIDDHLTATLQPPKDGRSCLRQGATTRCAWEPASTSLALLALAHLWVAFLARSPIGCVALHLVGEAHGWLFFTMPPRSAGVLGYAALSFMDNRGHFAHSRDAAP
jgi:hypothetical protein